MRDYRHEIEQILSTYDYESVKQVQTDLAGTTVAQFQAELSGSYPPAALACEVDCWRRRLAEGFRRRPLRRLVVSDALRKFIQLRLGHP